MNKLEKKMDATMEWLLEGCCPNCGEYTEDCECGWKIQEKNDADTS